MPLSVRMASIDFIACLWPPSVPIPNSILYHEKPHTIICRRSGPHIQAIPITSSNQPCLGPRGVHFYSRVHSQKAGLRGEAHVDPGSRPRTIWAGNSRVLGFFGFLPKVWARLGGHKFWVGISLWPYRLLISRAGCSRRRARVSCSKVWAQNRSPYCSGPRVELIPTSTFL